MSKSRLYFFLSLIALLGLLLRIPSYDRVPPFGETKDEFMYPWAGISLLKTGVPTAWSPFSAYPDSRTVKYWGEEFRLVSPWLEKPLLYSFLTGGLSLVFGENEFSQVRLSTIRLIPVALSFFTILLVGLFAYEQFGKKVSLVASLIYSTVPTIVLGNRMSLTENLLVPIILFTLWIYASPKFTKSKGILISLGCAAALLTKQIGLVLPLTMLFLLVKDKQWKMVTVVGIVSIITFLVLPLMGLYYGWDLYQAVTQEFARSHAIGFPETIATLFRTPGIGHKESIFLDGTMLAGFILLFSSPFWYKEKLHFLFNNETMKPFDAAQGRQFNNLILLLFPFIYITMLSLLEGGTTWYGWHLFPLYPFLMILLAIALVGLFNNPNLLQLIFFVITIGASSLRFILLLNPSFKQSWQTILAGALILIITFWLLNSGKYQKKLLAFLFAVFILINIYTVLNLSSIYPTRAQPAALSQTRDEK